MGFLKRVFGSGRKQEEAGLFDLAIESRRRFQAKCFEWGTATTQECLRGMPGEGDSAGGVNYGDDPRRMFSHRDRWEVRHDGELFFLGQPIRQGFPPGADFPSNVNKGLQPIAAAMLLVCIEANEEYRDARDREGAVSAAIAGSKAYCQSVGLL